VMTTASGLMAFEIDAFPISPLPLTVSLGAITFTVVSSPPLLFPDILGQTYERMPVYLALLSSGTTANDQRRRFEQHDNLFNYKLGWTALSTTQAWALNDVVQNCSGGWRLVVFFEWPATQSVGVTLGTGTGAEQEFTLPSAYTTGITPYIDGVAKTFTLDPLSGINGEDRIIFALADVPAGGSVVTADFTGRRRRTVRIGPFEMDDISAGDFRWQVSLELYGMREPNTWPFSLT